MNIYKYQLEIQDSQTVEMPAASKILSVANQNGMLCLWAHVIPNSCIESRVIEIAGTGNHYPPEDGADRSFIGTVVFEQFVWHVFEKFPARTIDGASGNPDR